MANYGLQINSRFKPFTYEQLAAPLEKQQEVHNQVQEKLGDLQAQAQALEALTNEQADPLAYAQYKKYSNDLQKAANELARNGLQANTRQDMYNLKGRYSSEIMPIINAAEARNKEVQKQRENPNFIYDRDAATTSLDAYIKNPLLGNHQADLPEMYNEFKGEISNLAKQIQDWKNGTSVRPVKGAEYAFVSRYGLGSLAELEDAISNPNSEYRNTLFNNLMNKTLESRGMNTFDWTQYDPTTGQYKLNNNGWGDYNKANKAYNWLIKAMPYAMGEDKFQLFTDQSQMDAIKRGRDRAEQSVPRLDTRFEDMIMPIEEIEVQNIKSTIDELNSILDNNKGRYKVGHDHIEMFNSDGTLKSEEEFVQSAVQALKTDEGRGYGRTRTSGKAQEEAAAKKRADREKEAREAYARIIPALDAIDVETKDELLNYYNSSNDIKQGTLDKNIKNKASFIEYDFKGLDNMLEKALNRAGADYTRDGQSWDIREITGIDSNGNYILNQKDRAKLSDLGQFEKTKKKFNFSSTPILMDYLGANGNVLAMKINGKLYGIPTNSIKGSQHTEWDNVRQQLYNSHQNLLKLKQYYRNYVDQNPEYKTWPLAMRKQKALDLYNESNQVQLADQELANYYSALVRALAGTQAEVETQTQYAQKH